MNEKWHQFLQAMATHELELCDQAMHTVVKACSQHCLGLGPRLANDAVNLTIHHKFAINERAQTFEWFSIWKCRMDNSQLFFPGSNSTRFAPHL